MLKDIRSHDCVIVKLQTSRKFASSSILGGEEEELVRAHAVQVLVGPVAVGGGEDVLRRNQAAAAVGLHAAILHRDTSTSTSLMDNYATPEDFSALIFSTRTFQGTFSAQVESPPTILVLTALGQVSCSFWPQMSL